VHRRPREPEQRKRVLVAQGEEAEDEVERLEVRDGEDGAVEVVGEEVEEDFGVEEGVYGSGYLVCREKGLV